MDAIDKGTRKEEREKPRGWPLDIERTTRLREWRWSAGYGDCPSTEEGLALAPQATVLFMAW